MTQLDKENHINSIYKAILNNESEEWTSLDELLELLSFLDDDQLHREADVILFRHSLGQTRCPIDHPINECNVPKIVAGVGFILEFYQETGKMSKSNRYILEYYLALAQSGMIVVLDKD